MDVRKITPSDTSEIASLERDIFSVPWCEKDILSAVCSECAMCYCALDSQGEIVAYFLGSKIAPEGEIYRIATRGDKRGRGIAYRLLDYVVRTEAEEGLESLFLEVRESNVAARGLYTSYGFTVIGRRKKYYTEPTEDAIIMALIKE